MTEWTQDRIEREYIKAEVEESLTLEYKAAAALEKTDRKKLEVSKDVSAMANSAGGRLMYGVKEYDEDGRRHLPEKTDPVDGSEYTREWLEQVISNVRPRVDVAIHPARADGEGVVYVVDVPPGITAHQARDYRYYRRYNFEAVPMEDHEVRDVMNRQTVPDVTAEFSHITKVRDSRQHVYSLRVVLVNKGPLSVRRLKLDFTFPDFDWTFDPVHKDNIRLTRTPSGDFRTEYYPLPQFGVLFPGEERDITDEIELGYHVNSSIHRQLLTEHGRDAGLVWTLHADDMPPKRDTVPVLELIEF